MTVAELIEKLKDCPQTVEVCDENGYILTEIKPWSHTLYYDDEFGNWVDSKGTPFGIIDNLEQRGIKGITEKRLSMRFNTPHDGGI